MMRAGQFFCSALLGGGDLLSHFRSTIGAVRFNFSVRDGKRWSPHAIATLVSLSVVLPCLPAVALCGCLAAGVALTLCKVKKG